MPKETRRNSRRVEFEDSFEEAMSSSRGGGAMLHLSEELVPKFSGQDKTYPATKWIQDVEDNAEVFGWTPVQQLLMARRSLTGTAALWLRAERMYKTWDELKASLLKEFPDTIDSKTIHEMMSSRVKKSDESCIDYMLIMKELGKRGKMPDYVAIKYIIDGIRDDPMKKMMLYGVTTYSELKEKFKIYETIKEDSKTKKTPNLPNQEFRNKPKSKCYSCGENNHMSNECPHKPKGLKCFRCNEFGHISSQCTSTAGTSKSHQRQNGGSAASHMCVQKNSNTTGNNNIPNGNKSERQNEIETSFGSVKMAAMTAPQETTVANDMSDNNNVNEDGGRPTYRKPMKEIILFGKSISALIDSGSDINLISIDCLQALNAPKYEQSVISLSGLGSTRVYSLGFIKTNIFIDGQCFEDVILHVLPRNVMPFSIILGQDFLKNVTFVMEGSRVLLLKSSNDWYRNFMCSFCVSDVIGYMKDPELQEEVRQVVETYRPNKTKEAPVQLRITLKDDVPVAQRPRRLALAEQQEVERQVKQWLEDGVVRVSYSEYASPLVLVKKKDGSTRICVDYRQIKKKMVELISRDYHIQDLHKKIDEFMVTCIPCLLATKKSGKQEGFLHCIDKGSIPLHTLHCDHIGPLSETKKQYNYILTIVDAFTKFVWVFPTKSTTAKETLDKLRIHQQAFGNPYRLITDRGAAFTSNEFKEYCQTENIQHTLITTGIPRGNGQVERIHRILVSVLTKLCISDPGLWYKHVARLQTALNSTYQRSIDTTPFELMFGTKMRTKEDIEIYDMLLQEERDAYICNREQLRCSAKAQILKVQEENRRNYNKRRKVSTLYHVGDRVAIMRTQFGTCLKLKPKFLGPYRVTAVTGKDRYDVEGRQFDRRAHSYFYVS
ncbi:uncharacterized protein [Choristoneura fumiferana]|uniref:uncharacterized protein n=1 Tax=Choristoneura fumiferana TaxID=7141 RepID=UPI003D153FA4